MRSKKKKKKSNKKKLEEELWELVKEHIRKRDNCICQKCGKKPHSLIGTHTSHVFCKKTYKSLKYDEQNLKILCMYCHKWWHNNPLESSKWFEDKFPERWEYLMVKKNEIVKMNEVKLTELIEEYKSK